MGSLLHKLGELCKGEFNLETSMKEDIESLSEELVNMQSSLRKVSEVQHDNLDDLVKLWASNVREMSYDLEDFVDGFLVHSELDTDTTGFRELTHEMCLLLDKGKSHHMMHDLIKDKGKKVQDVARKCKEYKVDNVVPNASAKASINDLRSSVIYKDKKELVGIEVPSNELMWLFAKDDDVSKHDLKIVSIVGLGGLGKTTLAKAVYDKLKAQYDLYTFISDGQNPDVKKVLESIIGRFVDGFRAENLGALIEKLQELLEYKRYFIVIDDIWDSSSWKLINSAFPRNSCGSRVITTTRIHDVAIATCNAEIEYVYKIKPLSEEDSRRLFFRRTFGTKKGCPDTPRKEEISIDILKRCGGMPLAINCMASLLAGKTDSTWEYVRKTLGAMIEGNTSLEGNIGPDNMMQILDLSYIHLPDYLKTCLLHICMYPEDHEVDKNDLLKQWVAEDFVVSTNGGLDAEDVAEMYLKELINRCMVQPGKKDHNNEVVSCRVHDIILDLMRSKSSRDNFSHVIDGSEYGTAARGQIRRVSAHNSDKKETRILETIKKGSLSHVRSVLIYRCSRLGLACFMELRYVRVLHIEGDTYMNLSGINGLFLLRYLKVTKGDGDGCGMKLLDQIGALQQLETIDIVGAKFQNYPSDIVSLPRLSHLIVTGMYNSVMLPDGIERLKSLRTLGGVDLPKCSVENIKGLSKLTNLRTLHIGSSIYHGWKETETTMLLMDALHTSISMLSGSLRVLTFQYESLYGGNFCLYSYHWRSSAIFTHIRELDLAGCEYKRCPEWVGQLHHLYKFTIMVKVVSNGMSIVAGLPSLAYLWLETNISNEYMEESIVIPGHGAFEALKHLIFRCSMASLTFETGAMPKLEKLEVRLRYEMNPELLPVGIQHLPAPTLQEIRLRMNMNPKITLTSRDWDIDEYCAYRDSDENQENYRQHKAYLRDLFKEAFNPHHPGASIILHFNDDINFGKVGVTI